MLPFLKVITSVIFSVLSASALFIYLNNWGVDFQFPLIRSPKNSSGILYAIPAALSILTFYVLTGYLILFGLSIPLVPESNVSVTSFELAIGGIGMVGLIRVLTLLSSIATFRTLMSALVLSIGFSIFIAFIDVSTVNEAILKATTNPLTEVRDFTSIILLPVVALVVFVIADLFWYIWIKRQRPLMASVSFIESIQTVLDIEQIGFERKRIHQAYIDVIHEVTSSEGIWELCWVSSMGAEADFYQTLVERVAARKAVDTHATTSFDEFRSLSDEDIYKKRFMKMAQHHLEDVGMFLIRKGEKDKIETFKQYMGFEPGTFLSTVPVRFLIINRKSGVTSWSAHSLRLTFGKPPRFKSTMFSRLTNPSRIDIYLKLFDSIWGNYQINQTGIIHSGLPGECKLLLDVIIERSGRWTEDELKEICIKRYKDIFSDEKLQSYLSALVENKLVKESMEGMYQRIPNKFKWQERWLRIHGQFSSQK